MDTGISPLAHEAIDDEVGGAVGDEHQVVDCVGGQQPGWVRGRQAQAIAVNCLVQDVDLCEDDKWRIVCQNITMLY